MWPSVENSAGIYKSEMEVPCSCSVNSLHFYSNLNTIGITKEKKLKIKHWEALQQLQFYGEMCLIIRGKNVTMKKIKNMLHLFKIWYFICFPLDLVVKCDLHMLLTGFVWRQKKKRLIRMRTKHSLNAYGEIRPRYTHSLNTSPKIKLPGNLSTVQKYTGI